jgi:3-oxoacyl-[acyl-carrier-protein] synthase II
MRLVDPLIIRGLDTISAVGASMSEWDSALSSAHDLSTRPAELSHKPVFRLAPSAEERVEAITQKAPYRRLDRSVLSVIATADESLRSLDDGIPLGCISIGSSRGPTYLLEQTVGTFVTGEGRLHPLTSPTTTAGNISSWVAQHYLSAKPQSRESSSPLAAVSTSMTCSSAFHSLLVSLSFIRSGMASACLFGGAESCLTPYTLAQLEALRIYTTQEEGWPCRPLAERHDESISSLTLGEAAGTALLLSDDCSPMEGDLALLGVGWAVEAIPSATGISADGQGFKGAMKMALAALEGRGVDAVIAHAPGTPAGDLAELRAIEDVFGEILVCTSKHLTGHTYGASGMVSLELARLLLSGTAWPGLPYTALAGARRRSQGVQTIAINTAGFGGNAITLIVGLFR